MLCPEVTAAQAAAHGRTSQEESEYLLVHGILHLLGFDHAEPEEKADMFGLKDKIIAAWELARPDRAATDGAGPGAAGPGRSGSRR